MRVAVLGAGAMGTVFGAALQRSGADVTLVDVSPAVVERLRSDGAVVVAGGQEQVTRVAATTDPVDVGAVDAVLVFVKGYHTAAAAELARPLVGPATAVASLQNGWGNEARLAEAFGGERIVAGVTYHSARLDRPGRVAHTATGTTFLGPFQGRDLGAATVVGNALADAGLPVEVGAEAVTQLWRKLVLNCVTLPASALTRLTVGGLASVDGLLEAVTEETCAIARAAGHDVDTAERLEVIRGAVARGGDGKGSMLQDVEAGRRTEIDTITGAVVAEADRLGVPAPLNRALLDLVRGYERANGLA